VVTDAWVQPSRETVPDHRTCDRCATTYRRPHLGVGRVATVRPLRGLVARDAVGKLLDVVAVDIKPSLATFSDVLGQPRADRAATRLRLRAR
jgi:hypothetical protein